MTQVSKEKKTFWILKIEKPKDGYLPALVGAFKGYFPDLKIQFKEVKEN